MHVNYMHYMYRQVVMHISPYFSTRWPVMPKPVCGSVFGEIINNSKFARVFLLVLTKLSLFVWGLRPNNCTNRSRYRGPHGKWTRNTYNPGQSPRSNQGPNRAWTEGGGGFSDYSLVLAKLRCVQVRVGPGCRVNWPRTQMAQPGV